MRHTYFLSIFYWLCYYCFPNFSPFIPPPPWTPQPSSIPRLSSCPWVVHISSLSSLFPIPFLTSSCLFNAYQFFFFPVPFPLYFSPTPPYWKPSMWCPFFWFCSCSSCLVFVFIVFLSFIFLGPVFEQQTGDFDTPFLVFGKWSRTKPCNDRDTPNNTINKTHIIQKNMSESTGKKIYSSARGALQRVEITRACFLNIQNKNDIKDKK